MKASLNERANHVIDIYLQLAPPVTTKDFERIAVEICALMPATSNSTAACYRWKFIAGQWSVSCDANRDAARAMASKMRKRDYRTRGNGIPSAGNLRQYTANQFAQAVKRTPELEGI